MPHDLGDSVALTFLTVNAAGTPANCDTVTLTITKPDGTFVTPAVVNPPAVTGTYTATYLPDTAGRYLARWVATVTNPQAYTEAFDVREAAPPLLFSLSDAKNVLNIAGTANDAKLRDLIESVTAAVEYLVGSIVRRSVSERYEASGSDTLVLRSAPVLSLATIVPIMLGGLTYAVADVDIDSNTGIIQNRNGLGFYGPLRITYVAGRMVVPAALRDAARMILKHLWAVQTGQMGLPRLNVGNDEGTTTIIGLGYALPNRAIQLLQPYLRVGNFA